MIQGADGNFYGTTSGGGTSRFCTGIVFMLTPSGQLTTLHSFDSDPNCADGEVPQAGLVQGSDGNFYGTTRSGGICSQMDNPQCGTIFKITPTGTLTTLYTFCTQVNCPDGYAPTAGLIQATDGNFYGTTTSTIFEITPGGAFTVLASLGGIAGNELLQATDGNFYGTTFIGGIPNCRNGCGTAFSLTTGLGPFVAFVTSSGRAGQVIGILGQGFTGTTSVSLNSIPAAFTVKSDTFITATVPPGATSGFATVVTPSGTLTSNVPFRVLP